MKLDPIILQNIRDIAANSGLSELASPAEAKPHDYKDQARKRFEQGPLTNADPAAHLGNAPTGMTVEPSKTYDEGKTTKEYDITALLARKDAEPMLSFPCQRAEKYKFYATPAQIEALDRAYSEKRISKEEYQAQSQALDQFEASNSTPMYLSISREKLELLQTRLEAMAEKAGINPTPRLVTDDSPSLNAFAENTDKEKEANLAENTVRLKPEMLANLSVDELSAIMAHEVGHIKLHHAEQLKTLKDAQGIANNHKEEAKYIRAQNKASTSYELQADQFAIAMGYGRQLENALLRTGALLHTESNCKEAVKADEIEARNASHPSIIQRVATLMQLNDVAESGVNKQSKLEPAGHDTPFTTGHNAPANAKPRSASISH